MTRKKSTSQRGQFKKEINAALYKSKELKELLLGDTSSMSNTAVMKEFKNYVKSHLFIDDTITDTSSFIFYDVIMPSIHTQVQECHIVIYAICHRDILDNYSKDGYFGNRADIMSQMIEDVLLNNEEVVHSFGIGELILDSINIYNGTKMYGTIMNFSVHDFRRA